MEPNWFCHQIHQKQIIGAPISKSYEPLIAEDNYELTADCCLQLPYMSTIGKGLFSVSACTLLLKLSAPLNFQTGISHGRNVSTKKRMTNTLISSSRAIDCTSDTISLPRSQVQKNSAEITNRNG